MNKILFLFFFFYSISTFSQSGGNSALLKGIDNETINVVMFDDDCKKCNYASAANASLKKAIETFFTTSNNINYLRITKENRKAIVKDKNPKYYLTLDIETVVNETVTVSPNREARSTKGPPKSQTTKHVRETRTYIYRLILSKRRYSDGQSIRSMTKRDELISAYRLGEVADKKSTDMLDIIPLGIKVMNAHIQDGIKFKTLNPKIIASNNSRKLRVDEIQIFRRFASTRIRVLASVRAENNKREHLFHEAFKAPVKFLGFNEILQKVYTQEPEENAIILTPNKDCCSNDKKIFGSNYYGIDLSTGKLVYMMPMKGIKFGYFGKKDLEKLGLALNSKYSTKKKK